MVDYDYMFLPDYENMTKKEAKEYFESFYEELMALLMDETCEAHYGKVEIDEDVLADVPKMYEIGANILY